MPTAAADVPAPPGGKGPKREIRFGLVLYGGVSLAIYIYGVVYEFWRLVRANRGRERNEYSKLLEDLGVRVTIDIVSGTSAGGINGILLAKALATGAGMDVVRSVWVDQGDLLKLLRDAGEREPRSLLSSERFDELLRVGLDDMDRTGDGTPLVDVVDLFAPATRLRPWIRAFEDYSGLVLETKDFRKVFLLKYRTDGFNPADRALGYNRNDFVRSQNELLAEVARATSAFPFAFEPRLIRKREPEDPRFARDEPAATYFADGGILDNKPFTEAIDTIYARAAFWPVSRWLISVEPDPTAGSRQEVPGSEPEVVEVVGAALMGIPRSESIATDLERLREHRVRVERAEDLLGRMDYLIDEVLPAAARESGVADVTALLGPLAHRAYRRERQRAVEAELVDRLLDCGGLNATARPYVEDGVRSYLSDQRHAALESVDLAFQRRRIYHLLALVDRAPPGEAAPMASEIVRARLWAAFERIEQRLWDAFGSGSPAAEMLAGLGMRGSEIPAAVRSALTRAVTILRQTRDTVEAEVGAAVTEFDRALPPGAGTARVRALRPPWHGLSFVFRNFELWDVFLVVVEHVGGVSERDAIKHRHITPAAATYIRKAKEDKLAGDALGHFGGFLKKSWRQNDILWGRLDAAEIIVDTLLRERERSPTQEEVEEYIRSVQEPIARAECQELRERPHADYRLFLEQEYAVGSEDIADVAVQDRAELVLRGADVFRNMLRRLQRAEFQPGLKAQGLKALFHVLGRMLGTVLFFIRWPVRAVWGRDVALRRFVTLALFVAFVWAVATLVLALFDIVPLDALAGTLGTLVGAAILLFLTYVALLGVAARAKARRRRRAQRATADHSGEIAENGLRNP